MLTPDDRDLTDRLNRLTESVGVPVPITSVVHAGRAKVRRRRAVGTALAFSVAGVALAVAGSNGLLEYRDAGQDIGGFAAAPTIPAMVDVTPTPGTSSRSCARPTTLGGTYSTGLAGGHDTEPQYRATLTVYRNVIAARLDPRGQHLQQVDNEQIGENSRCELTSLGTKLGWKPSAGSGLGMVAVEVTTRWNDSQIRAAHGGWRPASYLPQGAVRAYTVISPGSTAVAIIRADGTAVAIDADSVFGNNSLTPVGPMGFDVAELLETAADPALQIP